MHQLKNLFNILGLLALFLCPLVQANDVESVLFRDIDKALSAANEANANVLAPVSYGAAMDLYKAAKTKFKKGKSIEKIKANLVKAEGLLEKSIEATRLSTITLEDSIKARNGAKDAKAKEYAADLWLKAEEAFYSAAAKVEAGKGKAAKKLSAKAKTLFAEAELAAIKSNYLNNSRVLVNKAKKNNVDKYAPETYKKAVQLLQLAEKALDENRYDIDEPRALAKQALYEAGHAIKIAKQIRAVKGKDMSLEKLILNMEQPVVAIAESVDMVAMFDDSIEDPFAPIALAIKGLQKEAYELPDRKMEIAKLEQEMASLEKKLGVQSDRIAKQEMRRKKQAQVEELFTEAEAIVLKKGDSIIIRMVGLNFKSGKSNIDAGYFSLLKKVKGALETLSASQVTIEGHTDSFGTDSLNLSLSQDRAAAVQAYLLANMSSSMGGKIIAQGYGETRPIGNNETQDGRRKNRRIDLVITYD